MYISNIDKNMADWHFISSNKLFAKTIIAVYRREAWTRGLVNILRQENKRTLRQEYIYNITIGGGSL